MENSKIEWTDHTFSPWTGCTKVSPGCDHCYAESWSKRSGIVKWGPHGERRRTTAEYWKQPLRWARKAREALEDFETGMLTLRPARPRVFCASLADVWDNQVPPAWRADLFDLIRRTPDLDWLLLTKRPENIEKMIKVLGIAWPWPNVWLGFTAEDQERFNHRWAIMRKIPAAVRFCSYEPAIGSLRIGPRQNFPDVRGNGRDLDWLICGGESGAGYRDMDPQWEFDIREDCAQAGISYFFKQMAGKKPIPEGFPVIRQFPEVRP